MKKFLALMGVFLFVLSSATSLSSNEVQTTDIRVLAYEYYDEYQLPDNKKWQQVSSIKIEGQNRTGSTQIIQAGPDIELEAILPDVTVPSEYWITVTWQGGEVFYERYATTNQREIVHRIYQPF